LGILRLGQGSAHATLLKLGVNLEGLRIYIETRIGSGPETKVEGNIPYSPRVKKVLALAEQEAKALNQKYTASQHILLGLLKEGEGLAAQGLKEKGVMLEEARRLIVEESEELPEALLSEEVPQEIIDRALLTAHNLLARLTTLSGEPGMGSKTVPIGELDKVSFDLLGQLISISPVMAAYIAAAHIEKGDLFFEQVLTAMMPTLRISPQK
jgi:ATP-dependent Clp protease ATP-binding subunit ClpA